VKARVLSPAIEEIADAAAWLDLQRVGLGAEFWQMVDELLVEIEANPFRFGRSEFATSEIDLRFAIVPRFHFVIHFAMGTDEIQIAAVAHGSRRPGYWLRRVRQ
jgi:hypothetical protein